MRTRLRVINLGLGLVACLLAAALARELLEAHPLPPPAVPPVARPRAAPGPVAALAPPLSAAGYSVIAAKNLFSPGRSEAAAGPVAAPDSRLVLHGVVMDGPKSRAYLEDPVIKRTFGYAAGDAVGGGRVESIAVDRVVIGRGDGLVEVLLHDPSKPKPIPAATAPSPGAPIMSAPNPLGRAGPGPATSPPATTGAAPGRAVPGSQAERQ